MRSCSLLKRWLDSAIPGQPEAYQRLVIRTYAEVIPCALGTAFPHWLKGLYYAMTGRRERKIEEFLRGSAVWGERVRRFTRTTVVRFNDIDCPQAGHLILVNHVNELDAAFDCLVLRRPYLANQTVKRTLFAYWWMRAMGSEVFDQRRKRTISRSVRALLAGLRHRSYVVYPEGSNTYGEEIGALRKGMLQLAFEERIPVFLVLKSGMASFQQRQRDIVVGYIAHGTIDPTRFPDWRAFRAHIHALMCEEKARLDERMRSVAP